MVALIRFVRDQSWQFVGVLLAIAFGAFSIYAFNAERKVHSLQVEILANTSLVEVEQSVANEISVLYKDQSVNNLSLVQVKIENIGNQVVRVEDYARPIKFIFPTQAQIVETAIIESVPADIGLNIQTNENTATLTPVLLNAGDRVIVRFLVINLPSVEGAQPFVLEARIAEISHVIVISALDEPSTPVSSILGSALNIVIGVTSALGLIYLILGGIQFVTSGGDQIAIEMARTTITNAMIAFVIVVVAYLVVSTILQIPLR